MSAKANILIVDDEPNTLASLSRAFRLSGHEATVADNATRALQLATAHAFDVIFSDVVMPGRDGLQLLEDLRDASVNTPVVMMSGQAHIEMAVKATRLGAIDFLEKPISSEKLLVTVENALRLNRLERENSDLKQQLGKHTLIWKGAAMQRIVAQLERVAATNTRVCINGETGTGKELIARTLHAMSSRKNAPFVTLNCAAVPAELIESELFGHEKGSFTGAVSRQIGRFERADGGTLFLDEIGDMPTNMQAKLLRVLEESEIERIGSEKPIKVDVRIVVATHRDLQNLVRQGSFREDLFHRIYVFPIVLPPLRERPEDIVALTEFFSASLCRQNGWKPVPFDAPAMQALQSYSWPGNVRELRNVVERALLFASDGIVDLAAIRVAMPNTPPPSTNESEALESETGPLAERVTAFERHVILKELTRQSYNVTRAAESLGLERSHVYKKCEQLGIDLKSLAQERRPPR